MSKGIYIRTKPIIMTPKRLEHNRKVGFQKGHKTSKATRIKIGLAHKGKKCPYAKPPHPSGKNHPMWKGGVKWLEKLEKMAGRKRSEQCEICGSIGVMCFDHNHNTNKFRGWICKRCNLALGLVKDNIETLISMSEYLKKNQ